MTERKDSESSDDRHPNPTSDCFPDEQLLRDNNDLPAVTLILYELRSNPTVWVPFLVAGFLLTLVDVFRERDPLPVQPPVLESTLQISYSLYPTGTTETSRSLDALVDLSLGAFAYATGLELLAIGIVAAAGWLTMRRASETVFRTRRLIAYVGGILLLSLFEHSSSAIDLNFTPNSLLIAVVAFAVFAFVAVRLFFLPIAVLHVKPLRAAPEESWQRSRGHGIVLFALIVVFGLASGWLANLPHIGVVLSMTVVGTIHAISIAILYDQA